jgi:hypothetical protein
MRTRRILARTLTVAMIALAGVGITSGVASARDNDECAAIKSEIRSEARAAGRFAGSGQWNDYVAAMNNVAFWAERGAEKGCS